VHSSNLTGEASISLVGLLQSSPPELPESPEPPEPEPLEFPEPELLERDPPEPPEPESSDIDAPPEPDFPDSSEDPLGEGPAHEGSFACSASAHLSDALPLSDGLGVGELRGLPILLRGARTACVVDAKELAETK
jgi:hypothetical protein